jgi:HK97 family phage prohead protease
MSNSETQGTTPVPTVLDLADWKQRVQGGDDGTQTIVRKQAVANAEDIGERRIKFTISTGDVDRENDRLRSDGWVLTAYRKNPVVMFAHDYKQLPVARAISIEEEDGRLVSTAEFATADLNPFADTVYRMIKGGFLNAVSVGFRPQKFKSAERDNGRQGFDFEEQELLEYSVVPIPANPHALIAASKDGIDVEPITAWAKSWLTQAEPESTETKGMVPNNPSEYGLAPMNEMWSRPSLRDFTSAPWDSVDADKRRTISRHFTYAVDMPPANYGDLKLPHHRSRGADVVFRGVAAAAGRLDQTDFTADDFGKIRAHLANHYKEFDRVAPWERDAESWTKFIEGRDAHPDISDTELGALLQTHGFTDEAESLAVHDEDLVSEPMPEITDQDKKEQGKAEEVPEGHIDEMNRFLDAIRKEMNNIKVAVRETIKNVDRFQNTFQYVEGSGLYTDKPKSKTEAVQNQASVDDEFIELVEGDSDLHVDIDPDMLRDVLIDATTDTVSQVVNEQVRAVVNRASGRVD